jgi:hypothetical protein
VIQTRVGWLHQAHAKEQVGIRARLAKITLLIRPFYRQCVLGWIVRFHKARDEWLDYRGLVGIACAHSDLAEKVGNARIIGCGAEQRTFLSFCCTLIPVGRQTHVILELIRDEHTDQ